MNNNEDESNDDPLGDLGLHNFQLERDVPMSMDNSSHCTIATIMTKPEELLVFGYIRQLNSIHHRLFPDSLIQFICYHFYFQRIGQFLIIFESACITQNSFIKSCDISNQWAYLPSPQRKTNMNCKNTFLKRREDSFCYIPSIPTNSIPGLDQTTIKNSNNISNVIYRIGGTTKFSQQYTDIGCILESDTVFALKKLHTPRYGNRTIYSKKHGLITLGGCNLRNHHYLSSIEQLIGDSNWNTVDWPNMITGRFCPAVISLNNGRYNEQLFVSGGKQDSIRDLSTCELYLFQHKKWINISSMKYKRNSSGICEWNEKNGNIIVVGGYNGISTRSVERYDFHKNRWYELPKTNEEHKNCCCVTVYYDVNPYFKSNNGVLVVFGNDGTVANGWGVIEYYDDRDWTGKWNVIKRVDQCVSNTINTDFLWVLSTQ